ncbi:ribulokinase [Leminorella grimontii]|uniref:Ribulokinase n=1 Tax=Leminorella grimontii TaxID=82981 RepID=A0AAV5N8R5_9GAMM|nr:FGGY-family carbohydrate kinase [Leminorella grimontii]KFC92639.1 D-ribulokinase [Leminorella grimontii ATCC 33999 = DSM 5078]GKX57132.1 ribulokinase [Leminorella grimontii]VFS62617.1 Ribulokinase [Leminorella grimontii]
MEKNFFIGVDVGSASVRAGIFTPKGERLAFAVRPIAQFHSGESQVEQSSADIWLRVCETVKEAVALSGVSADAVSSIGFDATCSLVAVGEGGSPVSVSESGSPERDIVMWMDHRATEEATAINLTNDPALQYVGGEVSVEMELPKILWIKRHYPERYRQVWRFFDLADYLVWRASGADAASVCTLTCKWNYLAHEGRFSDSLLADVGLEDVLSKVPPKVLELGERAGTLCESAAHQLGLTTRVVVAGGIIDAHAGGLALAAANPAGSLTIISGTSNCHMVASADPVMVPGVWGPYFGAMLPKLWLNEGGQSAAGALVDWTLNQSAAWAGLVSEAKAQGESPYALLNRQVELLERQEHYPTCHYHILADHHGNRSPRANPDARGMASGLSLETGVSELARRYLATLQAIAYGTRHIIESLVEAGHRIERIVMCGGATKNPLWLREYANATGRAIHLAEEEDPVTLGAALLGAVACGAFDGFADAARAMVREGRRIEPDASTYAFHDAKYCVYLQMYQDQQRYADVMYRACSLSNDKTIDEQQDD